MLQTKTYGFLGMLLSIHYAITDLYLYYVHLNTVGTWCWISDPNSRIFMGYIPLWICIVIVIVLNIDSIRRIRENLLKGSLVILTHHIVENNNTNNIMIHHPVNTTTTTTTNNNNNNNGHGSNSKVIPKKTRREFIRLIVICILYAVVHVPASYIRVMGAMNKEVEPKLNMIMVLAFAISLPLPGILNFFIWGISDEQVINDWIEYLKRFRILRNAFHQLQKKTSTSLNLPTSSNTFRKILSSYRSMHSKRMNVVRPSVHSNINNDNNNNSTHNNMHSGRNNNIIYPDNESDIEIRLGIINDGKTYNNNIHNTILNENNNEENKNELTDYNRKENNNHHHNRNNNDTAELSTSNYYNNNHTDNKTDNNLTNILI